eukprot:contig_7059_g1633
MCRSGYRDIVVAGVLDGLSKALKRSWSWLRHRRSPVERVLASQRRLRPPQPDGAITPPDYDTIFQPTPAPALDGSLTGLERQLAQFWQTVAILGFVSAAGNITDGNTRKPLLYLLASVGRGKTLFLRAAARYITSSPSVPRTLGSVVVLAVSFNGSFSLRVVEKYCTTISDGYYLLLYVRILYCELAYLGSRPASSFEEFLETFYEQLKAKKFSLEDVRAEVRNLFMRKAGRGGTGSKVLLFVDELNCLWTSSLGQELCAALRMDLRYPIRSEACALTDVAGGVTLMTSLESGLMLAEQTASGRVAEVVQEIEPPSLPLLVGLMSLALWQRQQGSASPNEVILSVGSKRHKMKVVDCAEIYALAVVSNWRAATVAFLTLLHIEKLDFLDVMRAVRTNSSTGLIAPTSTTGLPRDLWSTTPAFRDAVLVATILSKNVAADDFVLPRALSTVAGAESGAPPISELAKEPSAIDKEHARQNEAKKKYELGRMRKEEDLLWGDVRALGLITAGGDSAFSPVLTSASLTNAVDRPRAATPLWRAFESIIRVVSEKAYPQGGGDSHHSSPMQLANNRSKRLVGVRWEQFFFRWAHLHSIARSFEERTYAAITLRELFGTGATSVGDSTLLQRVLVDAAVAQTEVRKLRGQSVSPGERPETVAALLSESYSDDERCSVVFELPNNCPCFDGAIFLKVRGKRNGLLRDGVVVVWVQTKIRGATVLPSNNVPAILKALEERKAELIELFGGQERYDYWLPRSCYLHVLDNELTNELGENPKADNLQVVTYSDWAERSIVRSRPDFEGLFGETFCNAGRLLGLLGEAGLFDA